MMFIKGIINVVPAFWLLVCTVIAAALLVTMVLAIKKRYFPFLLERDHNDSTVVFVRVLSALYAMLIALTIVTQVNAYNMIDRVLTQEANAYAAVMHQANMLPPTTRAPIIETLSVYINLILTNDWNAMHYSNRPNKIIEPAIKNFYAALTQFQPANSMQQILASEMLRQFNFALDARAQRWSVVGDTPPEMVKGVMLLNVLALLFMTCMLGSNRPRAQRVFIIVTNSVTFCCFVLIFILDFPFSGSMAIKPEAFTLMYHIIS